MATYLGEGRVLLRLTVAGRMLHCLVEADDLLFTPRLINTGVHEPTPTRFLTRILRRDDHCLDIGANFGYYTLLFASRCPDGMVISVEPQAQLFRLARDNVNINHLRENTVLMQAALCDGERSVTLHRRAKRSGNTSMAIPAGDFLDLLGEPPSEVFTVPGHSLDGLMERFRGRLDVVKLDVEGAEPLVIAGAGACIAANPGLQILMEWSPGQMQAAGFDPGDFLAALQALKLRFFTLEARRPQEVSRAEMLTLGYRHGILIAREPR